MKLLKKVELRRSSFIDCSVLFGYRNDIIFETARDLVHGGPHFRGVPQRHAASHSVPADRVDGLKFQVDLLPTGDKSRQGELSVADAAAPSVIVSTVLTVQTVSGVGQIQLDLLSDKAGKGPEFSLNGIDFLV